MKRFFFLLFISIFIFIYVCFQQASFWWKFQTNGQIWSSVITDGVSLYIGNSSGEIYSIDPRFGKERWKFKLSNGSVLNPVVNNGRLYFFSSKGVLFCLDKNTGKELWRYEGEHFYSFFTSIFIRGETIVVQDSHYSVYAINASSGKINWIFHMPLPKKEYQNDSNLSEKFFCGENKVIAVGHDGFIYALNIKTGETSWKTEINGFYSTVRFFDKKIVVKTKEGYIAALNYETGKLLWKTDSLKSTKMASHIYFYSKGRISLGIIKLFFPFLKTIIADNLIETYTVFLNVDGTIDSYNVKTGKADWSLDLGIKNAASALIDGDFLYFGDSKGVFRAISLREGRLAWQKIFPYEIKQQPFIIGKTPFFDGICSRWNIGMRFEFCGYGKRIAIGDTGGSLVAYNGFNGKVLWEFLSVGGFTGTPYVKNFVIYIPSINGALYRLNSLNGKTFKPRFFSNVSVQQNFQTVDDNNIFELTIKTTDTYYPDPWRDVKLEAAFEDELNKTIHIDGFYYEKNTWKIRFNPPQKGKWNYRITMRFPDGAFEKRGKFLSQKDTKNAYPKVASGSNRLTLDGKTIFSGIGIGDAMMDSNCDGNPLDDFFIGDRKEASASFDIFGCNESSQSADLLEYLDVYGDIGKMFNIFRWSVGNASFDLFNEFGDPDRFSLNFFLKEGKNGDTLVQTLVKKKFYIWMTLFFESVPFENQWDKSPV